LSGTANIGALEDSYGTGISPCPHPNMESSPHMYDNSDYIKAAGGGGLKNVKVKPNNHLYTDDYSELAELSGPEISLDLRGLIDETPFNEGSLGTMIQEIQGLHVEKPGLQNGGGHPRGLGANTADMYNPLNYMHQAVHGHNNQIDRGYHIGNHELDRHHNSIKQEPYEDQSVPNEYNSCRMSALQGYVGGYTNGSSYATMTPTTIPGLDHMVKSPMKSPTGSVCSMSSMKNFSKKPHEKGTDEYKRRRERNNIAVRKSREKAKIRSRETEERVKKLVVENDRLHKKCELLSKEVAVFHSMFTNVQFLPEHVQREVRKQMEAFHQQHQHLLSMWWSGKDTHIILLIIMILQDSNHIIIVSSTTKRCWSQRQTLD